MLSVASYAVWELMTVDTSHETINQIYDELPKKLKQNLCGLFETLTSINNNIKNYDKRIAKISKDYPETETLQQIKGVGPDAPPKNGKEKVIL